MFKKRKIVLLTVLAVLVILSIFFYKAWVVKYSINLPADQIIKIATKGVLLKKPLVPSYDHIVIILMENKTAEDVIGNKSAPYINSLASQNSLAANYFALSNPSLPNYLGLVGGSTFGINSDCTNCFIASNSIIDRLEQNHKSWKTYMESMPSPCFLGDAYPYAQKHDPFIYFNNIRNNPERCKNIVPLGELSQDLSLDANFIWITPNLCNDMHDCSISQGDTWLSRQVPQILNSPNFRLQKSLLVLTWDEGEGSNNKVTTILIGSNVKKEYISDRLYTHYSLLKTIEVSWNLSPLTINDQNSQAMSDFFQ